MCGLGGGGGSQTAAADQARADENARQERITGAIGKVNDAFAGFGDDFYAQRGQAYQGYAIPQLDLQAQEARRKLGYQLASRGLTRSSVAAKSLTDFERDYALQRQGIADESARVAQQARADVEGARTGLIGIAQSTGDAATAGNSAVSEAARLAATPTFSPLGQVFQNAATSVGDMRAQNQVDAIRRSSGGVRTYDVGSGSGKVVG